MPAAPDCSSAAAEFGFHTTILKESFFIKRYALIGGLKYAGSKKKKCILTISVAEVIAANAFRTLSTFAAHPLRSIFEISRVVQSLKLSNGHP